MEFKEPHEKIVIRQFVEHWSIVNQTSLSITDWPDDKEREKKDVDAIAEDGEFKMVIEHTSIDAIPNQRQDNDWFVKITNGLNKRLLPLTPDWISIALPSNAVPKGHSGRSTEIRDRLAHWLCEIVPQVPYGAAWYECNDVPFKVHIAKTKSDHAYIFIARFDVDEQTKNLPGRLKALVARKSLKLSASYAVCHKCLVIENDDIALMSVGQMRQAAGQCADALVGVSWDEIWFSDASCPDRSEFHCLYTRHQGPVIDDSQYSCVLKDANDEALV